MTTLDDAAIQRLKHLAKQTSNPTWSIRGSNVVDDAISISAGRCVIATITNGVSIGQIVACKTPTKHWDNAYFIEAANPQTVLALIERIEELEAQQKLIASVAATLRRAGHDHSEALAIAVDAVNKTMKEENEKTITPDSDVDCGQCDACGSSRRLL